MTNQERADKLDAEIYGLTPEIRIKLIASQLDEVFREALQYRPEHCQLAKLEGFALAREKAAEILESCQWDKNDPDIENRVWNSKIATLAERIRSLSATPDSF